jgi:hypothetical protein
MSSASILEQMAGELTSDSRADNILPMGNHRVRLRCSETHDARDPTDDSDTIGSASGAVPLLWMALFDYGETHVRLADGREIVVATTLASAASERAYGLLAAADACEESLRSATQLLSREIEKHPTTAMLVLDTSPLVTELTPAQARVYVGQLFALRDLWERVRTGQWTWDQARSQFQQMDAQILQAIGHGDERLALHFMLGSLADKIDDLSHALVSQGQARDDTKPQALAVGDSGLLLGRFDGVWKLIGTSCAETLHDVWSDGRTAYVAGGRGTLLKLAEGHCRTIRTGTQQALYRITSVGRDFVVAAGGGGTLVVRTADGVWHTWSVPTTAALTSAYGTSIYELIVAGDADTAWRYDGYTWSAEAVPAVTSIANFIACGDQLAAIGQSERGHGRIVWSRGRSWDVEATSPEAPIEGGWTAWGEKLAVVTADGLIMKQGEEDKSAWNTERLRADACRSGTAGDIEVVIGKYRDYGVIWEQHANRWEVAAAVEDLELRGIWCAGQPKPPPLGTPPKAEGATDNGND